MRAGFCSECATNVWLRDDGSCQYGHPRAAISGVYEVGAPVVPQTNVVGTSRRLSKRQVVLVIALSVVVAFGLLTAAVFVVGPLVGKGLRLAGDWEARVAADYPGWEVERFDVGGAPEDASQTAWTFTLGVPGRDLKVGIVYLKNEAGAWVPQDDILRPAGSFHERSESLLDYLERDYAKQGKRMVSVRSVADGRVIVNWNKSGGIGPFAWSSNGFDALTYDQTTDSWSR